MCKSHRNVRLNIFTYGLNSATKCLRSPLIVCCGLIWFQELAFASPSIHLSDHLVRVACVGDSITFGAHLRDPNQESYPAVLGQMLGPGFEVRNFGVGGATLLKHGDKPYFKQSAYTNALASKPDVVVILLGTNDSKHPGDGGTDADKSVNNWQSKADFVSDYEDLIRQFRNANPEARIFVGLPTPDRKSVV